LLHMVARRIRMGCKESGGNKDKDRAQEKLDYRLFGEDERYNVVWRRQRDDRYQLTLI